MNHYCMGSCQVLSSTSPVNCVLRRTLLAQFPLFPVLFILAWITNPISCCFLTFQLCLSLSSLLYGTLFLCCLLCSHIFSLDDSLSFFFCCIRCHPLRCSHSCSQPVSSPCEMFVALCKSSVPLSEAICLDDSEKCCRPVKCQQERICFLLETTKERDLAAWNCHLVLCCVGRGGKRKLAATTELFLQQKRLAHKGLCIIGFRCAERLETQQWCSSKGNLPRVS